LAQIAKHSVNLAEQIVNLDIFPRILTCLKESDPTVSKNAATCIREIAKHTPDLGMSLKEEGKIICVFMSEKYLLKFFYIPLQLNTL
jgi:vesicle coat complex subunit